jgi:GH24 family phage-related lysozyme (muramidase)
MTNRFLLLERNLQGDGQPTRVAPPVAAATSKKSKCTQFSEIAIDDDAFVLDVLQFFFEERLAPEQLNDDLRELAARAAWAATEGSRAMDLVPRPTASRPSLGWLVKEAVQIGFRRAQNRCIYEAVRVTVKRNLRSEYELAKNNVFGMSLGAGSGLEPSAPVATVPAMTTSQRGIDMIAGFERFAAMPYTDAANDCRVGFGHLVHPGPCNGSGEFVAGISEERAHELLVQRVRAIEPAVNRVMPPNAAQHQYDAIVSFVTNIGVSTFEGSRIADLLSTGNLGEVAKELLLWVNGDGAPIRALVDRRRGEAHLFTTGEYPGDAAMAVVKSLGIDLREFEWGPRAVSMQAAGVDWCQIRHNIIRSAVEMQGEWLRSGALIGESHGEALPLLVRFWEEGVGMPHNQAAAVAALSAQDHPTQAFWSAAFISWCVRNSMPSPPPAHNAGFTYHMRHMAYIADAARNRAANDASKPFWLFDINDPNVVPEDGDILCLNRGGSSHSFASVNTNWVTNDPNSEGTGNSHCDIVIGHFEDAGRRWIETLGGNVGDTVGSTYYSIDAQGRLLDGVQLNGIVINGKQQVTQTVGTRPPVVFALIRLTACPNF